MKKTSRILLGIGFFALLLISWIVAASAKSPAHKQADLITEADAMLADKIYVRAMPLLEEAAGYKASHTEEAETLLKRVYLQLIDQSGMKNKYTALLDKQMNRADARADVFQEAANYYIRLNKLGDALGVLKSGIAKLKDKSLIDLYEAKRYAYQVNQTSYENVTMIANDMIQVSEGGLWCLANSDGSLVIPCEYDKVSNYSNSRAIVKKGNDTYAVDMNNNRIAVLHEAATDIGNYANDRIGIRTSRGWQRATGDLAVGSMAFEDIGMYSDGYAAAKQSGKWGVVDIASKWLIPAEYTDIIRDELGSCYAQGAVFAVKEGKAHLLVDGKDTGKVYEDARPFTNDGWAAARQNGKWGFIDTSGTFKIEPQFDDALSFSGHLAAVKQGEVWGYVALTGKIAIEPQFMQAKSFSNGNAPVLTDQGYQFISLVEYERGVEL
ncbi:WG repeat-containing protein [Paenibacillus albus]|uniref:WG repeat-containing protein n=1 Tax=Paenibacillus albus TaxID=2495582 RepID=A0A3S9A2S2_9BACL|nr:WG repeat-containing protein [Paenibacillus albus]AZN39944.1 WG repeat-containing protein [Paenibacillus albus]